MRDNDCVVSCHGVLHVFIEKKKLYHIRFSGRSLRFFFSLAFTFFQKINNDYQT